MQLSHHVVSFTFVVRMQMWLDRLCICWWMFCAMDNISFKTIRLEPGPLGCHGNWQNMEWLHSVNMITVHDYEINLWCFAIGWPGPRVPSIISWEKKNNYVPLQCWELQNWIQSHMATPDGYLPYADTTLAEHLISTLGRGVLWMQWVGLSSWPGESFKSKYVSTLFGDNHWNVYIYIYNKYIIYNLYIYIEK